MGPKRSTGRKPRGRKRRGQKAKGESTAGREEEEAAAGENEAEPVFGRDAEDQEAGAGIREAILLEVGGGSCSAPFCAGETTLRWPGEASSCAGARILLVDAPLASREERCVLSGFPGAHTDWELTCVTSLLLPLPTGSVQRAE